MHLDSVYPIVGGNMEAKFISEKDCIRVEISGEIDEYGAKRYARQSTTLLKIRLRYAL